MSQERRVRINGKTFLYRQKAPFVESGMSVKGALEIDDDGKVRCHECGEWFKHVGSHAYQKHLLTARQYKDKHGLKVSTSLISEETREKMIPLGLAQAQQLCRSGIKTRLKRGAALAAFKRGKTQFEHRNEGSTCHAQLSDRIVRLYRVLGRVPTIDEANGHGISVRSAEVAFNLPWREIIRLVVKTEPRGVGKDRTVPAKAKYTKEFLIETVRDFYATHHRLPSTSDYRRGVLPDRDAFKRCFGSVVMSYIEAGICRPQDLTGSRKREFLRQQFAQSIAKWS